MKRFCYVLCALMLLILPACGGGSGSSATGGGTSASSTSSGSGSGAVAGSTTGGATTNVVPMAYAGTDLTNVVTGSLVTLSGSGSDANGDALTYHWVLVSIPAGSTAVLSDPTIAQPTFTADKSGTYVASLTVNDGSADSLSATVTVTATSPTGGSDIGK